MLNNNVFKMVPSCVSSRLKLKGVLADVFPDEKRKVNLILNAYDEGIVRAIDRVSELDMIMFNRWKDIIIDSFGVSEDNADWAIRYWFMEYGVAVCGRKCTVDTKPDQIEKKEAPVTNPIVNYTRSDEYAELQQMKDGEKIPKNLIEVVSCNHKDISISILRCSVRKEYDHKGTARMILAGEYSGSCNKRSLIMMMLYNANGEMIEYIADTVIRPEFTGQGTFSEAVYVPSDETISKATVRIIPDPTWL